MLKLILVDDEMWSREVVKRLIHFEQFDLTLVAEAQDGYAGLEAVRLHHPDIVITDMKMPGLNGVEFLKKLSVEFPAIKTIVMSGFEDVQYLRQAIRSRSVEYLLKPIKETDINAAIANCVDELQKAKRTRLQSNRIFADESVQRDYAQLIKALNLAIIKHQPQEAHHILQGLKRFAASGNDAETLMRIQEHLIHQIQHYLVTQNIDFSYEIDEFSVDSIEALIPRISRIYEEVLTKLAQSSTHKPDDDWLAIRDFIDQHLMYPISLDDVADKFHLSPEHVSRQFKKKTGEGITTYILRTKMERAADLILTSDFPMKTIAELVGFENVPYFYKQFNRWFACAPGEYKAKHRSDTSK